MDYKKINRLIDLLPNGEKKDNILKKLSQLRKGRQSSEGLNDEFSLKTKGHICIEEIDSNGDVVGVLADQKNLVVDGSEEILLRAFSGDADRILYKNRKLKGEQSSTYHVHLDEIISTEDGVNVVCNHPNELWKAVNDEEFELEYSYYPNTLYVKEEVSNYSNMKAFSIHTEPGPDRAPLASEIYSTFTNMFIGLGDGENYSVSLDDKRLIFSGNFTGDENRKETSQLNDEVRFREKMSNFSILYESRNDGGKIEVYLDESLAETIDTQDADLSDDEVKVKEASFEDLDHEKETEVRIVFSGSNEGIESPRIVISGIKLDSFSKDMNGLIREFKNHTLDFSTPEYYNTTTVPPYTVQLQHYPVAEKSVEIKYNNLEFEEVVSLDELGEGKFYVDYPRGLVHFNRALTDLAVTFSVTGQIKEKSKVSNLQSKEVTINVSGETPEGVVNGENRVFNLKQKNIVAANVFVNGDQLKEGSGGYSINKSTGVITLQVAPESDDQITVDYNFRKTVGVLRTEYKIDFERSISLYDQEGKEFNQVEGVSGLVESGVFLLDPSDIGRKSILFTQENVDQESVVEAEAYYYSVEKPGVETNYKREVVLKPKDTNNYPWYALDKGSVQFVAEFKENSIYHNVTIREMGLFDGPRIDDEVKGFTKYPVKAFSLVRVGSARKDKTTGLRVTWTITLTDEEGNPFTGGL